MDSTEKPHTFKFLSYNSLSKRHKEILKIFKQSLMYNIYDEMGYNYDVIIQSTVLDDTVVASEWYTKYDELRNVYTKPTIFVSTSIGQDYFEIKLIIRDINDNNNHAFGYNFKIDYSKLINDAEKDTVAFLTQTNEYAQQIASACDELSMYVHKFFNNDDQTTRNKEEPAQYKLSIEEKAIAICKKLNTQLGVDLDYCNPNPFDVNIQFDATYDGVEDQTYSNFIGNVEFRRIE